MKTTDAASVGLIFGTEHAHIYHHHGITRKNVESVYIFDFLSKAQSKAFLKGVDEASGWHDYETADEQMLISMGLDPELSVVTVFGEGASLDEDDEEGSVKPNGDDKPEPITFTFSTPEECKAFEKGLEQGNGWMEYAELSSESVAAYQCAYEKTLGGAPAVNGFEIELKSGRVLAVATYLTAQEVDAALSGAKHEIKEIRMANIDDSDIDHQPCEDLVPGLGQRVLSVISVC
jgi:hypothetical protein